MAAWQLVFLLAWAGWRSGGGGGGGSGASGASGASGLLVVGCWLLTVANASSLWSCKTVPISKKGLKERNLDILDHEVAKQVQNLLAPCEAVQELEQELHKRRLACIPVGAMVSWVSSGWLAGKYTRHNTPSSFGVSLLRQSVWHGE